MKFKPRTQKRIQNLSRAINKIDPRLKQVLSDYRIRIEDVEPGINTVKYMQNGVRMEIRYDELEKLGTENQASLVQKMLVDRYKLRQERALEQLSTKGKISWQFKRSLEKDAKALGEDISFLEKQIEGSTSEGIASAFKSIESSFEEWEDEAEDYFNDPEEFTDKANLFYHLYGFEKKTKFTWNSFKVLEGIS